MHVRMQMREPTGLQDQHLFGHHLREGDEATLRIEPCVRAELLVVWLEALDNARYAARARARARACVCLGACVRAWCVFGTPTRKKDDLFPITAAIC